MSRWLFTHWSSRSSSESKRFVEKGLWAQKRSQAFFYFVGMALHGIFVALTTPFDPEGGVYREKILENIRKLNGVPLAGYAVCGSTGETPMLSLDERIGLLEAVREASAEGRTLIAGLASDSVHESVRIANRAAEIGYQFALALTPFYYRAQMQRPETQSRYYREVADRSKIPVLLYNMPGLTGYDLPVPVICRAVTASEYHWHQR